MTLSYNIPTTASEINDFINLVQEIQKQLKKIELYCVEEEKNYTVSELINNREQQAKVFARCNSLDELEKLFHEKQNIDVYYAKPRLLRNNNTGRIGAFYTLTEECESIFPIRADGFINLDGIKVDDGMIGFYIYSAIDCGESRRFMNP